MKVPSKQRGQRSINPKVIIYCMLFDTGTLPVCLSIYQEYLAGFICKKWEIAAGWAAMKTQEYHCEPPHIDLTYSLKTRESPDL